MMAWPGYRLINSHLPRSMSSLFDGAAAAAAVVVVVACTYAVI